MRTRNLAACSLLVCTLMTTTACGPLNTTQKNALGGGILGAGAGALIGHQSGHTGGGAAIGGALGALAGGALGYQMQGHEETQAAQQRQINRQASEIRKLKQRQQRADDRY
jgi:uncharacterized protein YcfJ